MNIHYSFFKLLITLFNLLRLWLVFVPLIYAILLIRTPAVLDIPLLKVLFLSFAPALALSVWNALRFEQYPLMKAEYYQKSKQNVCIEFTVDPEQTRTALIELCGKSKKWKWIGDGPDGIRLKSSPARDQIVVRFEGTQLCVQSRPYLPWLFIDFGNNYKNVIQLLLIIKNAHQKA